MAAGPDHAENELFKKSLRHDAKEATRGKNKTDTKGRYMMIQDAYSCDLNLSISEFCRSLEVSRSGYSYG
jgi:hypothetical protein